MIFVSLRYEGRIIPLARSLRKNATKQENHLWYDYLNQYPLRFQRQKTITHYVADFYCHQARLVIELDGSQHYSDEGMDSDAVRTEALEKYGLTVLRFSNSDIDRNFEGVCAMIDAVVKEQTDSSES